MRCFTGLLPNTTGTKMKMMMTTMRCKLYTVHGDCSTDETSVQETPALGCSAQTHNFFVLQRELVVIGDLLVDVDGLL